MIRSSDKVQGIPSRFKSVAQWIWTITLATALIILIPSAIQIYRVHNSASWPTTAGMIDTSDLTYSPISRALLKYKLQFTCHYTVDGARHEGQRVSFAGKTGFIGRTGSTDFVKRVLRMYPKGTTVTVHYHPTHPRRAVLETEIPKRTIQALLLGIGMALLSSTGLWRRWSLQSDYIFRPYNPYGPMTVSKLLLGGLGLVACLANLWIWWELIKKLAGR